VIPECIPGELAGNPVVLVKISRFMRKDHVRATQLFEAFEEGLDLAPAGGQETVFKAGESHLMPPRATQEGSSGMARLSRPLRGRAQDNPGDREPALARKAHKGCPAADLYVVTVGADAQYFQHPAARTGHEQV
jgi:hypothetical protein